MTPNPVAIVQARMGSTRLPGKVLLPLTGRPVLDHVVSRLGYCKTLAQTVVATTIEVMDDPIAEWCISNGVPCFRGSVYDVLDRYYQAAINYKADPVVRITADCPAIDPTIVDEVVRGFLEGDFDLYGLEGEFPDGLDCAVFAFSALETAWRGAKLKSEREHVGPYIINHPEKFKIGGLNKFHGLAHHRWTLDEPRDYEFLKVIFDRLYREGQPFLASDVLTLLDMEPSLMNINSGILRNEGYAKSLAEDSEIS